MTGSDGVAVVAAGTALLEALDAPGVRAVVVRGLAEADAPTALRLRRRLRDPAPPAVAAVEGECVGHALALAIECDVRIATDEARFADRSADPDGPRCAARLAHLLGEAAARDLVLTGRTLDAADARRIGLVSRVVPPAALESEARAVAALIASRAPLAVAATRQAVGRARDLGPAGALAMEHDLFARLIETEDHKAAVAAFFARTRPVFRGA